MKRRGSDKMSGNRGIMIFRVRYMYIYTNIKSGTCNFFRGEAAPLIGGKMVEI